MPLLVPRLSLDESVEKYVTNGTSVLIGNFGAQLFSVGHRIIRHGLRDLDLIMTSGGILLDEMLGAGVVGRATFCHCWSPVGPHPARNFRRLAESGTGPELRELSIGALQAALTGAAWSVPCMPWSGLDATGYVTEGWAGDLIGEADTPFGRTTVVRSLAPDVAFVHSDRVDTWGQAALNGPHSDAVSAAHAARAVVVVAEQVVAAGELSAAEVSIPGVLVDAVVEHPGAVLPDGAPGRYGRDVEAYEQYASAAPR